MIYFLRANIVAQAAIAFTALLGCRTLSSGGSDIKVTNGIEATGFSAVVKLQSGPNTLCTGTFLNDSTVLTAAHCVKTWRAGDHSYPRVGSYTPDAVYTSEQFFPFMLADGRVLPGATPYDLAVVVFGAGAGTEARVAEYPKLATFPGVGAPVTVIGYGLTDSEDVNSNPDRRKHVGQNVIAAAGNGGMTVVGPCRASNATNTSAVASGDSGGPLLVSTYSIIAVASSGGCVNGTQRTEYASATNSIARSLLAQAGITSGGGQVGGQLCGAASQFTKVCINGPRTVVTIISVSTGQQAQYQVQQQQNSVLFPGGIAYLGVANLSHIQGMTASTQISFVVHPNGTGRLYHMKSSGWAPFGNGGTFGLGN